MPRGRSRRNRRGDRGRTRVSGRRWPRAGPAWMRMSTFNAVGAGLRDHVVEVGRPLVGGIGRIAWVRGACRSRRRPRQRRLEDRHAETLVHRERGRPVVLRGSPERLLEGRCARTRAATRDEKGHEDRQHHGPSEGPSRHDRWRPHTSEKLRLPRVARAAFRVADHQRMTVAMAAAARSPARPSHRGIEHSTRFAGSASRARQRSRSASGSKPTSSLVPSDTVTGRSVVVR